MDESNFTNRHATLFPVSRSRTGQLLRRVAGGVLGGLVGLAAAGSALAQPTIYHSINDDGVREQSPPVVAPNASIELHLYMDDEAGAVVPSAQNTVCKNGIGNERCGWDATIVTQANVGQIDIVGLSEMPGSTVVGPNVADRLRFNGGDHELGESGPVRLGKLTLTTSMDAEGEVSLLDLKAADAFLELQHPVSDPGQVIVTVPEPGARGSLLLGGALLCLLRRRSSR